MSNKRIENKKARRFEFDFRDAYGVKVATPKPKNILKYRRRNKYAVRALLACGEVIGD